MEVKVLNDFYDMMKWLLPKIAKFPRNYRYTFGKTIEYKLYVIMENIIKAKYSKESKQILQDVNIDLEILRYYLRLSRELDIITVKNHEYLANSLNEIGKQIGGWYKGKDK